MPTAVKLGDLDNDGDLDAVVSHASTFTGFNDPSSGFTVLLNQGPGYFGKPLHYATGSPSGDVLLADFNRDGKLDVAVTSIGDFASASSIVLFNGLGNGRFIVHNTIEVGLGPTRLATADFNGDGAPDLVVVNRGRGDFGIVDSTVSILMNSGTGSADNVIFLLSDSLNAYHAADVVMDASPYDIVAEDLNDDGHPDIAFCNYPANVAGIACGDIAVTTTWTSWWPTTLPTI